ncbi:hypothetical protein N7532_005487 [Penicillium argentinense]|uniref:Phosducin domain-containing protein n=1 Tax=Penicillium argentinense TaxID=1131581 RepID=A0A9W9FE63_9EURO|nr:uncharacterized protein N7532_005487 [Penicillium argentinense]KAJ5098486.1 hypothetical protein N7532_005487 [Penicillium argentinense]
MGSHVSRPRGKMLFAVPNLEKAQPLQFQPFAAFERSTRLGFAGRPGICRCAVKHEGEVTDSPPDHHGEDNGHRDGHVDVDVKSGCTSCPRYPQYLTSIHVLRSFGGSGSSRLKPQRKGAAPFHPGDLFPAQPQLRRDSFVCVWLQGFFTAGPISILLFRDEANNRNACFLLPQTRRAPPPQHFKSPHPASCTMSAQEEFNQLVNSNRERASVHPEDRDPDEAHFSDDEPSTRNLRQSQRVLDSSDEDEVDRNMVSSRNYHIPNTVYEANTGPKGVIADAQAFERARKKSFRQTLLSAAGFDPNGFGSKATRDQTPPSSDRWVVGARRASPRGRRYGTVDTVDAAGYLDAIERVTSDTVVVVCIYDPLCDDSAIVEECLVTIARRQPSTRFVKLHQEIAEMNHIQAPALLAYRGGDVFSTIVDVIRNIPKGRSCSADSLEDLLKLNRVL